MRINHNMMAMNTHRQLGIANTAGAKSMEKLSSGYRINRAGDDAAGLAISEKMRGQIRGLNQASTNAQDAISLIQTTEGALNETHAILQRMRELAVQSSTDTNTDADRLNLQDEIEQLTTEITRISETTEFNTMKVLDGTFSGKKFHIGANQSQNITFDVKDMGAKALGLESETKKFTVDGDGASNVTISTFEGKGLDIEFVQAKDAADAADDAAKVSVSKSDAGKITVSFGKDGVTLEDLQAALKDHGGVVEVKTPGTAIDLAALIGSDAKIGQFNQADVAVGATDVVVTNKNVDQITVVEDKNAAKTSAKLVDGKLTVIIGADKATANADADSINKLLRDSGIEGVNFKDAAVEGEVKDIKLVATDEGTATDEKIYVDVSTQKRADVAITTINSGLEKVSKQRSALGAIQNRLEHTIKNLDTSAENLQASESRIRDVDMAKEMMEQTRQNILQQASTAMLAQANQAPQTVLQLLR